MKEKEEQRYGRNKATLVNKAYIEGGEYRKKFDNITDNKKVNKALYKKAKKMLKHRAGTLFEDMYWIDGNTGKVIASVTDSPAEEKIVYPRFLQKVICGKSNLITLHNHPNSMPPSIPDLNSNYDNGYCLGLVICHDGKVFAYKANKSISKLVERIFIAKFLRNGYNEYEAQLEVLKEMRKQGLFDFREVLP